MVLGLGGMGALGALGVYRDYDERGSSSDGVASFKGPIDTGKWWKRSCRWIQLKSIYRERLFSILINSTSPEALIDPCFEEMAMDALESDLDIWHIVVSASPRVEQFDQ